MGAPRGSGPPATPPPPPASGLLAQVLAAILNVQDWKRATLLIVLGVAGLCGVVLYQGRERVLEALTERLTAPERPTLSLTVAQRIADELRAWPDVTMASIWVVDVERNLRVLIAFAADADRTAVVTARPRLLERLRRGYPLLRYQGGANAPFIHVLNGQLWCGPPHPTLEEAPFYDAAQVAFFCVQGVPPEPGMLFGLITLGFATALSAGHVEQLAPLLWDAADRLTERHGKGKDAPP